MKWPRLYRTRSKYWSCSKLASWILNKIDHPKPSAATMEEWHEWHETGEQQHPVLYNIVEDWFDKCQNVVMFPYDVWDAIRIYFNNRFVYQSHVLRTNLAKGEYHENDVRLMHGMFELLVDFVEIEKSNMLHWATDRVNQPWWCRNRLFKWGEYRSREDGIEYLKWEMSLVEPDGIHLTHQAIAAREIHDLYIWWKDIRPAREDVYDVSGWTDWCDEREKITNKAGIFTPDPNPEKTRKLLDKLHQLEEARDLEDEQMLIRLVKVRSNLWT